MKLCRNIFDIYNLSNIIYMCKCICISVSNNTSVYFKAAGVTKKEASPPGQAVSFHTVSHLCARYTLVAVYRCCCYWLGVGIGVVPDGTCGRVRGWVLRRLLKCAEGVRDGNPLSACIWRPKHGKCSRKRTRCVAEKFGRGADLWTLTVLRCVCVWVNQGIAEFWTCIEEVWKVKMRSLNT